MPKPDTRYLKLRGKTWWASVSVPRTLTASLGSHLRASLRTQDLSEANRRKHPVVADLKKQIDRARSGTGTEEWRDLIRKAKTQEDQEEIELLAADWAESLEPALGETKAIELYRKAIDPRHTLLEVSTAFLASGLSMDSQRKHSRALRDLRDFLGQDKPPSAYTPQEYLAFNDSLVASPLAPNTKRDRLSSLGSFWKWLQYRQYVPAGPSPFYGVSIKGGQVNAARAFTPEELSQVLAAPYSNEWQRDVFLVCLLTGARPSEVCSLKARDIDTKAKTLSITASKTQAGIRTLPYRHKELVRVLGHHSNVCSSPEDYLFPVGINPQGKQAKNYINYFSRLLKALGTPKGVTLYSTRKTFIGKALDLGQDLVNIERYVGHTNQRLALATYSRGRSDEGLVKLADALGGWFLP